MRLTDLLRRVFLLGLGAISATREKAEQLVEELVKKGEMGREEAGDFLEQLLAKGEEQRIHLQNLVKKEMEEWRGQLSLVTKSDVAKLEERISRLEAMLRKEPTDASQE